MNWWDQTTATLNTVQFTLANNPVTWAQPRQCHPLLDGEAGWVDHGQVVAALDSTMIRSLVGP